jgi:hypothetical protein
MQTFYMNIYHPVQKVSNLRPGKKSCVLGGGGGGGGQKTKQNTQTYNPRG